MERRITGIEVVWGDEKTAAMKLQRLILYPRSFIVKKPTTYPAKYKNEHPIKASNIKGYWFIWKLRRIWAKMKHGKTIVDTTFERDFGNELSTSL